MINKKKKILDENGFNMEDEKIKEINKEFEHLEHEVEVEEDKFL